MVDIYDYPYGGRSRGVPDDVRADAVKRCSRGESMSVLAREIGVTREAVRLWVMTDTGMTLDQLKQVRKAYKRARKVAHIREIWGSGEVSKVSDFPKYLRPYVEEVVGTETFRKLRYEAYANRPVYEKCTDEEILADMRRIADLVAPKPFSGPLFDKHTSTVTSVRVLQRFDTWLNAVHAAGITNYVGPVRSEYTLTWTREDCIAAVREFLAEEPVGTYLAYDKWAQEQGDKPSGGTLRNRVDRKWSVIREIALSDDT